MARGTFGTRLRSLRELAGLTQTELAQAVGVSQRDVASWERNAAVPEVPRVRDSLG
jgi:transcriptional regulator with XRE-family HTH domain